MELSSWPSDLNCSFTSFLASSLLAYFGLTAFGLASLHNHKCQFLKKKGAEKPSVYTLIFVLFLWRTLTNITEMVAVEMQKSEHIFEEETAGLTKNKL